MGPTEVLLRLATAAVLGSLIGLDRQRLDKTAGLRTHMLVSVGSALVMIVSAYGFERVLSPGRVVLDPSRIAAQVVSGIGFLGAGTILRKNQAVHGLTTAASVWTVAGVGLAAGAGLYLAASAATGVILVILVAVKPLEDRVLNRDRRGTLTVIASDQLTMTKLELHSRSVGVDLIAIRVKRARKSGTRQLEATFMHSRASDLVRLADAIQSIEGVHQVDLGYD